MGKANSALEPGLCGMARLVDSGDFPSGHEQLHQRRKPCCWFAFESSLRKKSKSSTCQVQRLQVSGTQWLTWPAVKVDVDLGSWWHPGSPGEVHSASREPKNCSHLRNFDIYRCLRITVPLPRAWEVQADLRPALHTPPVTSSRCSLARLAFSFGVGWKFPCVGQVGFLQIC